MPIKDNTLIKRNKLKILFKEVGVKRVSKEALEDIEKKFNEDIKNFVLRVKEECDVQGKKTFEKKDFDNILKEEKEDFSY